MRICLVGNVDYASRKKLLTIFCQKQKQDAILKIKEFSKNKNEFLKTKNILAEIKKRENLP